jgi:hypothetical protein
MEIMENKDKNTPDNNQQENTNENANSAYSGSGSMQPGAGTGKAGKLNDYMDNENQEKTLENSGKKTKPETTGKSIAQATDPSKLSDL